MRLAWSVSGLTRGGCCAGLYVYLMSSWTPSRKADFYKYHRYLGLATYIAGLVAGARGSRPLASALDAALLDTHGRFRPVVSCPACVSVCTCKVFSNHVTQAWCSGVSGMTGLMETQEFDLPGVTFVGPESYRAATMLLAAKAFLSLLLGLTVTYAWVVLPQVTKATPVHAACAESGKAQAGMACEGHPAAQMVLEPAGKAQGFQAQPGL